MSEESLRRVLEGALRVWRAAGDVSVEGGAATVRSAAGATARVARLSEPFPSWQVTAGGRTRAHASLRGMLRAVRAVVDPGHVEARLVIGPRADPPSPAGGATGCAHV